MMRQQAISAIHAKMLRLNSASIAAVSVGKVRPVLFDCCIMQGRANTTLPVFFLKALVQTGSASFTLLHELFVQ